MPADAASAARATVVVVTWQGVDLLRPCLESLRAQSVEHAVVVVDNGSTDGTADFLAEHFPEVELLRLTENVGFAGGVAAATPAVRTPYLALLNNDAAAAAGWLEAGVLALERDRGLAGVASRMLLWDDDEQGRARINNAGVTLVAGGYGVDRGLGELDGAAFADPVEPFGFSGGAAILRTDAVRAAGGMSAPFFLYYEDTDLAWRLRLAGWRIRYEPSAVVRHRHGASSDPASALFAFHTERNRLLMLLRCAPVGFAVAQIARFAVTTLSLTAKRALRRSVAPAAVFDPALRLRVLGAVARSWPRIRRERRVILALATTSPAALLAEWVPQHPGYRKVAASAPEQASTPAHSPEGSTWRQH